MTTLSGRERRRKGLVNMLRRGFYALAVFSASGYAMAADEMAYYGQARSQSAQPAAQPSASWRDAQTTIAFNAKIDGLADMIASGRMTLQPSLGEIIEHSLGYAPVADRFLITVVTDDLGAIRNGIEMELAVPQVGNFHLNLQPRRHGRKPGKHLSFALPDSGAVEAAPAAWSLGGALTAASARAEGGTRLAFAPQLLIDLDQLTGGATAAEAVIQYANWAGASDKDASGEKVLQATFKWRF